MKDRDIRGFAYRQTGKRYVADYKDGAWGAGRLSVSATVRLNESACVLQYAQTCFEGLKAYRTQDGRIVCFRPDLNEARFRASCQRMVIPPLPEGRFIEALRMVVRANRAAVPPYESGGALYLRPVIFGTEPVLGVRPAMEYEFRLFASPVGAYFSGRERLLRLRIPDFDRAAPHGTGHVKAGLNYAMSLYPLVQAHAEGYDENLYVDAATRTRVEETGGANLLFLTTDGHLVTPRSPSILPSVTRRSLLYVAEHYLGIPAEEREILRSELPTFRECALCGTAAVLSSVGSVTDGEREVTYASGEDSVMHTLRRTLLDIQHGRLPAPEGWLMEMS